MSEEFNLVLAIVSMVIWILLSLELSATLKESKKNRRGKLIVLMSAGIVSTIFITLSLVRSI